MRPMLAQKIKLEQLDDLQYPMILQPKLDGVRALIHGHKVVSRTLKPLPNKIVQNALSHIDLPLDGEIIVNQPTDKLVCNSTVSFVMSEEVLTGLQLTDEVNWTYYVFDTYYPQNKEYSKRYAELFHVFCDKTSYGIPANVQLIETELVKSPEEVMKLFDLLVSCGYEGCVLRSRASPYKYGRSTLREQYLLKMKPYEDTEAIVVGFEPLRHNLNEQTIDERGYAKRSTHKGNKLTDELLGALICETPNGVEFKVGTGFNAVQREQIWNDRDNCVGKKITYTFLNTGVKDKPRNPVFKCFRLD